MHEFTQHELDEAKAELKRDLAKLVERREAYKKDHSEMLRYFEEGPHASQETLDTLLTEVGEYLGQVSGIFSSIEQKLEGNDFIGAVTEIKKFWQNLDDADPMLDVVADEIPNFKRTVIGESQDPVIKKDQEQDAGGKLDAGAERMHEGLHRQEKLEGEVAKGAFSQVSNERRQSFTIQRPPTRAESQQRRQARSRSSQPVEKRVGNR